MNTEITPILYNYENSKRRISNNLAEVQSKLSSTGLDYLLMAAPPFRRISAIPDKMRNDEITYSLGMAGLGLVNITQDARDLKEVFKQIAYKLQGKKYAGVYDFKNYQQEFSLCHGTLLERFIDEKKMRNTKLVQNIQKIDTTLLNTKFGQKVLDFLKIKEIDSVPFKQFNKGTKTWDIIKDVNGKIKSARGFSGSKFGVLTAHVLARTIIPELMIFSLVEIPLIYKAAKNSTSAKEKIENTLKQTAKSAITVASLFLGFGYLGAIGSKYFKVLGSLAGMGLGAIIGTKVTQKTNQKIN